MKSSVCSHARESDTVIMFLFDYYIHASKNWIKWKQQSKKKRKDNVSLYSPMSLFFCFLHTHTNKKTVTFYLWPHQSGPLPTLSRRDARYKRRRFHLLPLMHFPSSIIHLSQNYLLQFLYFFILNCGVPLMQMYSLRVNFSFIYLFYFFLFVKRVGWTNAAGLPNPVAKLHSGVSSSNPAMTFSPQANDGSSDLFPFFFTSHVS